MNNARVGEACQYGHRVDTCLSLFLYLNTEGDVAQSGEHLLCKQGVRGSNPLISTFSRSYLRLKPSDLRVFDA